jgi:hypothetical protein
MPRGYNAPYSKDQKHFLELNRELPRKELTEQFNEQFGTDKNQKAISSYCKRHGWLTGRDGKLQKGNKPWNTGTKGVCKPNGGSFTKGSKPANHKPIGHERICSKDGFILIKVDEVNPHTGFKGWYRHKHIVIWESEHGAVPDGYIIRLRDGNKLNCELSNLVCVSQAVNLRMNKNQVNALPDEFKETGRIIAQLEVKTFEVMRETQ